MEIESTGYGAAEVANFLDDLVEIDREALVRRLERASERLGELAGRVSGEDVAGAGRWNATEVLAHIAVLSKFYGVLGYRVGTGALTGVDLLGQVQLRDVAGQQMAERPPAELAAMARNDHRRTLDWLRSATPADLRRRCALGDGWSMTAEEVLRLPLTSHLEQHVLQLEEALRG
jgi:cell division septum initiation protein DivIVA